MTISTASFLAASTSNIITSAHLPSKTSQVGSKAREGTYERQCSLKTLLIRLSNPNNKQCNLDASIEQAPANLLACQTEKGHIDTKESK